MEPEVLLQKIDKIRSKYKGQKFNIEEGNPYIEESIELIKQFKKEICEKQREICSHKYTVFINSLSVVQKYKKDEIKNALKSD